MSRLRIVDIVALVLIVVGGLNWGLVGLFNFDLVAKTVGALSMPLARVVYVLVGVAALYTVFRLPALGAARGAESRPAPETPETHETPHPAS
jgi:hypothetical protein